MQGMLCIGKLWKVKMGRVIEKLNEIMFFFISFSLVKVLFLLGVFQCLYLISLFFFYLYLFICITLPHVLLFQVNLVLNFPQNHH